MKQVYAEAGVNPSCVAYVEAHGTGTQAGDPQEVNSIADIFCVDRQSPLLMGSVKSNMGHPECSSGKCYLQSIMCLCCFIFFYRFMHVRRFMGLRVYFYVACGIIMYILQCLTSK